MAKIFHFLQICKIKYHINHIIAALTTGADGQTSITNKKIAKIIKKICIFLGKIFIKKEKNKIKIKIVMLNQETAIKCVNQELLKFCFKSFGKSSLAQSKIQPKKIASFSGKICFIFSKSFSLKFIIFSSKIKTFFSQIFLYLFA